MKAGRLALVLAVLVAVGLSLKSEIFHLQGAHWQLRPGWLVVATGLTVVAALALPIGWRTLMSAYSVQLSVTGAVRAWALSQATRYLPTGGPGSAVSRAVLASRQGAPKKLAGVSLLIEVAILVLCGSLVGAAGLAGHQSLLVERVLVLVGSAVGLLAMPAGLELASRAPLLSRALPNDPPGSTKLYASELWYVGGVVLKAAAFAALAEALLPVKGWGALAGLGAAFQVGQVAGLLGVTPAGLGVREAVFGALAAPILGLGPALELAVAWRIFDLVAEMILVGAAVTIDRRRATA
jgi:uncharacterized membrane protein YbhN (UPF0104 family)